MLACLIAASPAAADGGRLRVPGGGPAKVFAALKIRARTTIRIPIAGHGGVPRAGVVAVAVTLVAKGASQLWIGQGPRRPLVRALVGAHGTVSAFTIVPLARDGSLRLWSGPAGAASVAIRVDGWFTAAAPGTMGLFTPLAGVEAARVRIAAGRSATVTVAGRAGLPQSRLGAVLVRLHAIGAPSTGTIGIGRDTAAAGRSVALAYPAGDSVDLAVSAVGSAGRLTLHNGGHRTVTVAVAAAGWFTDGTDPAAYGDTLHVVQPHAITRRRAIGTHATALVATGLGGIPAVGVNAPPSLVLVRGELTTSRNASSLAAGPGGSLLTPGVALAAARRTTGRLLTFAPGVTGATDVAASAGLRISAETVAYFAGGTLLAARLHLIAPADAITSLTATDVTFRGVPADLAHLRAGDLVYRAGRTGFLRHVVSIDASTGNLVLHTTDAKPAEAFARADITFGAAPPPQPPGPPKAPRPVRHTQADAPLTSCEPEFGNLSVALACNAQYGPVTLSHTIGIGVAGSLSFGALGVHASFTVTGWDSHGATLAAGSDQDVDASFPIGTEFFVNSIPIPAGPIELWVTPSFTAAGTISGHVSAGLSASAAVMESVSEQVDNSTLSFQRHETFTHDAHENLSTANAELKAGIEVSENFSLSLEALNKETEEQPRAILSFAFGPYGRVHADTCAIRAWAGLEATIGVSLEGFGITFADASKTWSNESDPFTFNWHNCAIWSGTVSYDGQYHDGAAPGPTANYHGAAALVVEAPKDGYPPQDGVFAAHGSGSGALVSTTPGFVCSPLLGPPVIYTSTDTTTWGGNMTMASAYGVAGDDPSVTVDELSRDTSTGIDYRLQFQNGGLFPVVPTLSIPASTRHQGLKPFIDQTVCTDDDTTQANPTYWFDVYHLYGSGSDRELDFTLAPGQTTSSGHVDVPAAGAGTPAYTVTWDLTKVCSLGGTDC
jgi:hypothetical protein